jgi:hypothetical protein
MFRSLHSKESYPMLEVMNTRYHMTDVDGLYPLL